MPFCRSSAGLPGCPTTSLGFLTGSTSSSLEKSGFPTVCGKATCSKDVPNKFGSRTSGCNT
eukprot:2522292-Alexandrium_andersonii.AAC.1